MTRRFRGDSCRIPCGLKLLRDGDDPLAAARRAKKPLVDSKRWLPMFVGFAYSPFQIKAPKSFRLHLLILAIIGSVCAASNVGRK